MTDTAASLPRIGDLAPDFTAATTHGPVKFSEWRQGHWVVLFSHPADFTPVCSTELTELGRMNDKFAAKGVKLIGLSIDSIHSHLAWVENLNQILKVKLPFPLIADSNRAVAEKYGMIHPSESETVTVRALFVIDDKGTIRATIYYPLNVGRNMDEVLRVVEALQTATSKGVACPANWKPGDKVIVPPPKTMKDVEERKSHTDYEKLDFYLCKRELPK